MAKASPRLRPITFKNARSARNVRYAHLAQVAEHDRSEIEVLEGSRPPAPKVPVPCESKQNQTLGTISREKRLRRSGAFAKGVSLGGGPSHLSAT
jgi:hypothetical protein